MCIRDSYVPAGRYRISDTIDVRVAPGIHGEGTAIIEQTNSSADIFYGAGVWRTQISGLHFMGGQNHLHFGTNNENTGFITVERCVFTNASSAAIRMIPPHPAVAKGQKPYQGSASTQVTVSKSEFFTGPNATQPPLFLARFSPKFRLSSAIFRPFSPSRRQEAGQRKGTAEKRRKTGEKRPRNSGLGGVGIPKSIDVTLSVPVNSLQPSFLT